MKINIHAGHNPDGMIACGAVGLIKESTEARKVKDEVIKQLEILGHTIYDCTIDNGTSQNDVLKKIVSKCNLHTVDLDISIHFNAGRNDNKGDGKTGGVECYTYDTSPFVYNISKNICSSIASLGYTNRGAKISKDLYVLRSTKCPALLIECCFVDDTDDVKLYNYKTMANAIVYGITGKKVSENNEENNKQEIKITGHYTVTADVLNVRYAPNTTSMVVGKFKNGTEVYTVDGKFGDNGMWKKCLMWNGSYGYVHSGYLQPVKQQDENKSPTPSNDKFTYEVKNGCHIISFLPSKFGIYMKDSKKRNYGIKNYFNLGYFAKLSDGSTLSVGNLADCGKILSQSCDFPSWVNTSNKQLTTMCIMNDSTVKFIKTNKLDGIKGLKTAVSGIPILVNGKQVSLNDIKSEGYFGNELYNTLHIFITYKDCRIYVIGAKVGTVTDMANLMISLGFTNNVIKLDGGGSFIIVINGKEVLGTNENRKVSSIGMFE